MHEDHIASALALFPVLHAQLLPPTVRKAGEGLEGFITLCMPLLISLKPCVTKNSRRCNH